MLMAGAGRHAKDLYVVLKDNGINEKLYFYDDICSEELNLFLNKYEVIKSVDQAKNHFKKDSKFIVGVGGVEARKILYDKLTKIGGEIFSVISKRSIIGCDQSELGSGLNIMPYVFLSESVNIGKGTLLNTRVSVHHDVKIGIFCDIAPGAILLGGCKVGDFTFIGANATILPNVKIGTNCIIGAGSVVTKNIPNHSKVFGVPARNIH